jgi:hypothetical protein
MIAGSRPVLVLVALLFVGSLPAGLATQEAPDTIVLKGATLSAVLFPHVRHVDQAACVACHHESKPELPSEAEYGRCKSCHTDTVEAPLVTNAREAFHDRRARQGLCVDCHASQAENGTKTPARCTDCHRPES